MRHCIRLEGGDRRDHLRALAQRVQVGDGLLNRKCPKTGNGNRWMREPVTSVRPTYRIPVFRPAADGVGPWLNLTDAARSITARARKKHSQMGFPMRGSIANIRCQTRR
ncbi:hypothetical protein [Ancylobacter sp. FA202]|uniref:hypothetical protein n=1 Tax=Ancylobacter sp. FA202 TaxID=1111106 RepID=UPI0004772AD3|nr:hypothetical protein [Ancylobacter sp. FA202]